MPEAQKKSASGLQKLKSRHDSIKSRHDSMKSRRDFMESRRDFTFSTSLRRFFRGGKALLSRDLESYFRRGVDGGGFV